MRRLRLSAGPAALFGAMVAIASVAFLPMRAVLGWVGAGHQGLVVRRIDGSIWDASLRDVRFAGLTLGDLGARVAPLSLLIGRATIVLGESTRHGSDGEGVLATSGSAFVSRHGIGIDDLTAHLITGRVFAPLPVTAIDLDSLTVRFENGRCVAASGRVRAILMRQVAGIALPPAAEGVARCDTGDLLLPLSSQAGTDAIALHLGADGRYRADLSLRPSDAAASEQLASAGFVGGPSGYRLSVQGNVR